MKKTKPTKRVPLFPVLIKLESKHSNERYLAKNNKDKLDIGLRIIELWKSSHYLELDTSVAKTFADFVKNESGISLAELNELATGKTAHIKMQIGNYSGVNTPSEHLKTLKRRYDLDNEYNSIIKLANEALKTKNGTMAWQVINFFGDYEYQKVKIRTFDNVEYNR